MGDTKVDGTVAKAVATTIIVNEDGQAPTDTTKPTISITNPSEGDVLEGIVNVTAEGDDDQALDKIRLYLDGQLLEEKTMPDYYPYPEVGFSLDTSDYSKGTHNLTAMAIDKANNVQETTIEVSIEEGSSIPGYQITTFFIGTLLGVTIIMTIYWRKNKRFR